MSDSQVALGAKNIHNWATNGLESGIFKLIRLQEDYYE
jgi:hypothetical protein